MSHAPCTRFQVFLADGSHPTALLQTSVGRTRITTLTFAADGRRLYAAGDALLAWAWSTPESLGPRLEPTAGSTPSDRLPPSPRSLPPPSPSATVPRVATSPLSAPPQAASGGVRVQRHAGSTSRGPGDHETSPGLPPVNVPESARAPPKRATPTHPIPTDPVVRSSAARGSDRNPDAHGHARAPGHALNMRDRRDLDDGNAAAEDRRGDASLRGPAVFAPVLVPATTTAAAAYAAAAALHAPPIPSHHRGVTHAAPPPHDMYKAPDTTAGLQLAHMLGFNTDGLQLVLWHAASAQYIAAAGCVAVVEDLENQTQRALVGHSQILTTLALTQDGTRLATAASTPPNPGQHAAIWLWHVTSGTVQHRLPPFHAAPVQCMAFSHDDRLIASVGNYRDPSVAIWDAHAGVLLATCSLPCAAHALAWDPTRFDALAAVGDSGTLFLLTLQEELAHNADIHVRAIDTRAARGEISSGNTTNSGEEQRGREVEAGTRHSAAVNSATGPISSTSTPALTSLTYAAGTGAAGVVLLTGDGSGTLAAWEPHTGRCLASWLVDASAVLRVHAAGRSLMTCSAAGSLKLWALDLAGDGSLRLEGELAVDGAVVSSSMDAVLALGLVATTSGTGYMVHWGESAAVPLAAAHAGPIGGMDISRDGLFIATGGADGSVRVWQAEDREQVLRFQVAAAGETALDRACTAVAFSADGERCVAGFASGALRVFDLARVELEAKVVPHTTAVTVVAFSADGRVILSGSSAGVLIASSATTGVSLRTMRDHRGGGITALDVCRVPPPRGLLGAELWLACGADRQISVWDADWARDFNQVLDWLSLPGGEERGGQSATGASGSRTEHADGSTAAASATANNQSRAPTLARFSVADPAIILCTGVGPAPAVLFYSLHSRAVLRHVRLDRPAFSLSVAPGGNLIAVGTYDRLVRLIDYATGKGGVGRGDFIGDTVVGGVLIWRWAACV